MSENQNAVDSITRYCAEKPRCKFCEKKFKKTRAKHLASCPIHKKIKKYRNKIPQDVAEKLAVPETFNRLFVHKKISISENQNVIGSITKYYAEKLACQFCDKKFRNAKSNSHLASCIILKKLMKYHENAVPPDIVERFKSFHKEKIIYLSEKA